MKARMPLRAVVLVLASLVVAPTLTLGVGVPPQQLQTPAERVNYSQGGTLYEPLMDFVHRLESTTDLMSVIKLTETYELLLAGQKLDLA